MARSWWQIVLVALLWPAMVLAGCGASARPGNSGSPLKGAGPTPTTVAPAISAITTTTVAYDPMCGGPVYTFTLPNGARVANGDCAGYLFSKPPRMTLRRGETFTVTPGDAAISAPVAVPRPNGPSVVVLYAQRTPHAGTRATYRAVEPGRALLLAPQYRQLCGDPSQGCSAAALVVRVTG